MTTRPVSEVDPTDESPLLSVIMPTHDVRPWLRETIESVLRQDVESMEIIAVDDHSTDGTLELLLEYAAVDSRLHVVSAARRGGGSARNEGLRLARGRYIVFCDGDDLIPDGAYQSLVGSLVDSGSQIAIGDYLKFRAIDTWTPTASMDGFREAKQGIRLVEAPSLLYSRPCWNKAFARDFLQEHDVVFPDVPRSNDIEPMVRAYVAAERIDVIPKVVYVYRERPGRSSMSARAGAAASLQSYLEQELRCARLVADIADAALEEVMSNLIWDRDGFQHVLRYAAEWDGDERGGASVAAALREVVDAVGAPMPVVPHDRIQLLRLVADEQFLAARSLARIIEPRRDAEPESAASECASLLALLRAVERRGRIDAGLAELLTEHVARRLRSQRLREEIDGWSELSDAAARVLGTRALMFSPESAAPSAQRASLLSTYRSIGGGLLDLRSRNGVVLRGTVNGDLPISPVLVDGLEAAVLEPKQVRWQERESTRIWEVRFDVADLPMHRPLTVGFERGGAVVAAMSDGDQPLPDYTALDPLLFDRTGGVTVIRRRRHWTLRAARRLALVALRRIKRS